MTDINEIVERVERAVVQDRYDTNDITILVNTVLKQKATLEHLASENQRLTDALEIAGKHITKLESMTHMTQYVEESSH